MKNMKKQTKTKAAALMIGLSLASMDLTYGSSVVEELVEGARNVVRQVDQRVDDELREAIRDMERATGIRVLRPTVAERLQDAFENIGRWFRDHLPDLRGF